MRQKKENKRTMKPIQGHYGLEFALAHMNEDLTTVFKALEKEQKGRK